MSFNGNSIFRSNSAESGGGICSNNANINFNGSSTFEKNSAENGGGFMQGAIILL